MRAARDLTGAGTSVRRLSAAQEALVDWLRGHLALESQLDHHGTAGWKYRSVYGLVAAHGRWFVPAALPAGVRALPKRQCFANAAATERRHPELTYSEGFALAHDSSVPTAHAWCTDADGHAIDPTWSDHGGSAYLGIVPPPALRPRAPRNWGVLEAPGSLFRLLRRGL
ncbi:hypothetical protein G3260_000158 [Streptomyces albus]|uniref:hypothetical protein n=1 Tax=Streptomyces albus TaxID=1888 RepID=UPI0013B491F0|nr:hypothetical protein [Streptomyces albus]QID34383.1 hypothetical protein G3260_000158 [Streptomyces albus]